MSQNETTVSTSLESAPGSTGTPEGGTPASSPPASSKEAASKGSGAGGNPPAATLKVLPGSVELYAQDAQAFSVDQAGISVRWELVPPQAGQINATGAYLAPAKITQSRSVIVIARSVDGAQYGTATVTLSDTPRKILFVGRYGIAVAIYLGVALLSLWSLMDTSIQRPMVIVNPPVVTLDPDKDEPVQFAATVIGESQDTVSWSVTDGQTIAASGLYRSKQTKSVDTSILVTARSTADPRVSGTATVILKPGQHLEIVPQAASASTSQQIPFRNPAGGVVNWSSSNSALGTVSPEPGTSTIFTVPRGIKLAEPVQVMATTGGIVAAAANVIVKPVFSDKSSTDWRLLLFVMTMGSLGSMIYFTSSFVNYVGNRTFRSSWVWFYFSRPFVGGALALVFFFIVGSGLVSGTAPTDLMKVALIAALVGLFSDKAVKKLSDIMDVILAGKDERHDKLPATQVSNPSTPQKGGPPKIVSSVPPSVKKNTPFSGVKFLGSNFDNFTVKVNDGVAMQPKDASAQSFAIDLSAADTNRDTVSIIVTNGDGTTGQFSLKVDS